MKKLAKIIALSLAVLSATPSFAATNQITGRQIRDRTITDNNIANGTIQSLQISDNTVLQGDISTTFYDAGTCTPTVTCVGGAGNTVPVYSTNLCRWTKIGRLVWTEIYLSGDGGAEGAGTGQINIALPFTSSASQVTGYSTLGSIQNATTHETILAGQIGSSATTVILAEYDMDGAGAENLIITACGQQNSTTRNIRLRFYEEI